MADRKGFDLGDYIEVKDRIARFYDLYGQGRLVTTDVRLTTEPDGKPRVLVEAAAYRTPDDPLPGRGWSWMELPGTTSYTKGSELENTETSAWGRAIAALGILVDKSIASAQEVANKSGEAPARRRERPETPAEPERSAPAAPQAPAGPETEELLGTLTKAGTVKPGGAAGYKLEARQTPDGYALGFRLEVDGDRAIPQVLIEGPLAADVLDACEGKPEMLAGKWAKVRGRLFNVSAPGRGGYYRLRVQSIETKEWKLPAEAASEPLFSADEQAAIDVAIGA